MKNVFHFVRWMMPTSGIVPIPCAAAAEAVVQLPANSKRPARFGSRVQDVHYVPFDKEAVALCSTVCCEE